MGAMFGVAAAIMVQSVAEGGKAPTAADPPPEKKVAKKDQKKAEKEARLAETEAFFAQTIIPKIRINITPADMDSLRRNGRGYVYCQVRESIPGRKDKFYDDVAIHLKGAAGSTRSVDDRPGLTLNFDRYIPDQLYHGLEKMHLNNCVQDGTYLSENIGNGIFRDADVPACRVTYARVWINNRDIGLYVLKEGFADPFLDRFFPEGGKGTIYEGGFLSDIDRNVTPKVNEEKQDLKKFAALAEAVREGDATRRRERIAGLLDVQRFYDFMAIEAFTAHWDGYCGNINNYRIYDDPGSGKLVFLPHGTDQLFGNNDFPLMLTRGMVAQALLSIPEEREKYLERCNLLRTKAFDPAVIGKRIDEVTAKMIPVVQEMNPDAGRNQQGHAQGLKQRIADRAKSIDRQLNIHPKPLKFAADGTAATTGWAMKLDLGNATFNEPKENGQPRLHLKSEAGGCAASLRTTVLLAQGRYTFEGNVKVAGVNAPDGENSGVGLRISGGKRAGGITGTADWKKTSFEFEVTQPTAEVVLVCELRAAAGEVWFDPASLKLRKR